MPDVTMFNDNAFILFQKQPIKVKEEKKIQKVGETDMGNTKSKKERKKERNL